jgi:hypothetical protein
MESKIISKVNKEKIFNAYNEISKRINDGIYEKLINDNNNVKSENCINSTNENNIQDNTKNMLQIISQLKQNITQYPLDKLIYKESDEIEIKNKNYIQINETDDFFTFKSYPSENLLFLIINNILLSLLNKNFCFKFFFMESFNKSEIDSVKPLNEKINNIVNNEDINKDIYEYITEKIFIDFTCRDILTFLGIRRTAGSIDNYIPLDKSILINKFKELNNQKSKLTVGAKALCKHSHRSVTDQFWPGQGGKEKDKNDNAEKMLNLFLNECVWINIHLLPHQLVIIELRIDKGYGIRWQVNDGMFRGFLEPQMEDGHEKGWIH